MGEARALEIEEIIWNGVTRPETIGEQAATLRKSLADAARDGRWDDVLRFIDDTPSNINVSRLGSKSHYAPLHQAAHHGAPSEVVAKLISEGAWRTLRNSEGDRPLDIAARKGHSRLGAILTPVLKRTAALEMMSAIQNEFHRLIRERAGELVNTESLRLPLLEPLLEFADARCWFPVPGMYGGFSYSLEITGADARLISDSWCRVVEGSEQRHVITPVGRTLIEDGTLQ